MDTPHYLMQLARIASGVACVIDTQGRVAASERSAVLHHDFYPDFGVGSELADLFGRNLPKDLRLLVSTTQQLASDICFDLPEGGTLALLERRPEGLVAFVSVVGADQPQTPVLSFFDNATDAVFYETGVASGHEYTSRNFENLLGYPRHMILDDPNFFRSLIHPDDLPRLRAALQEWDQKRSGEMFDFVVRVRRADGVYIRLHDRMLAVRNRNGKPSMQGLLTLVHEDNNEKLEATVMAERMDAVRRTSRSVAHDINNYLVVIQGYAELLTMALKGNERALKQAEKILRSSHDANAFTRYLNQIGHPPEVPRHTLPMRSHLSRIQANLTTWVSQEREFDFQAESELPDMVFDEPALKEVLEACARTIHDMTDAGDHVQVNIRTRQIEADEAGCFPDLKPGVYIEVRFDHSGLTCASDEVPRFFEPFFLKREKSCAQHNGLALTRVWNLMFNAGGAVIAEQPSSGGTAIVLLFPQSGSRVQGRKTISGRLVAVSEDVIAALDDGHQSHDSGDKSSRANILLAEDEPLVRELLSETLRASGFNVVSASDGQRALDVFRKDPSAFQIVVTDIVMPNMDGTELARQARVSRPDIPVLFVSGFTKNRDLKLSSKTAPTGFLQKPFTPVTLVREVQTLLGVD